VAEILGLGTTDQPYMRVSDEMLSNPLKGALKSQRLSEAEKDPASWPAPMREQWGDDQGARAGRAARSRQVEQFRKLTAALDDFNPDFILIWSKDGRESLKDFAIPQFWVQAHAAVDYKPYTSLGRKENVFGEDGDQIVTLPCTWCCRSGMTSLRRS
jgi:hypothetical protein